MNKEEELIAMKFFEKDCCYIDAFSPFQEAYIQGFKRGLHKQDHPEVVDFIKFMKLNDEEHKNYALKFSDRSILSLCDYTWIEQGDYIELESFGLKFIDKCCTVRS